MAAPDLLTTIVQQLAVITHKLERIETTMKSNTQALADLVETVTQLSTDTSATLADVTAALTDLAAANPSIGDQLEAQVANLKTLDANIQAAGTAAKAADPGATSTTTAPATGGAATS